MESSHSRNVGIGKLANKYWYSTKNPAQLKDPNIRNAVEGFPILLYINDEFMGVYNFNTDRYSNATFGYTDAENCLVYEVSANSDTTAGAFHSWSEASGVAELDYYKSDFLSIYPPTRRAGNDDFAEMKELVTFVDTSSDEVFIESINNNLYFNKEYLLRYLIYALLMGAVDSLGKNMKLATWDKGKTWYPQLYDCDTTMGLDNTGFLAYTNSNIKIEQGTYNTSNSRLWQRVIELFWTELQVEYAKMRNTYLTLDHIYECIIEEQMDKIPATYYNQDMQTKYLQFGSSYLYALHGQGKQQVMTWLRERLLYVDTYLEYWSSTSDYVTIRASKLGEIYLDLETYDNMFLQVKWRNTGNADDVNAIQIKEMRKGEVTRFTFNSLVATDQEIRIYGGKYLKSVGALDNLAPTKVFITNAPRLTEIVCHSKNLQTIDLSTCTNLQHIDLKDCVNLGVGDQSTKTIEVSQCKNLKYVNCQNTQILGINLGTKGTNVEEIWYPKSITVISLSNCMRLTTVGLEAGNNCNELKLINCPKVENFGDRQYNSSTNSYKYQNGWFLSGIQKIYLDNSYIKETDLCIAHCVDLTSITVKNMPNLERIKISTNVFNKACVEGTTNNLNRTPNLDSYEDLVVTSTNCPKLKEFITTDGYNNSKNNVGIDPIGFFVTLKGEKNMDYHNRWATIIKRVLDLSKTNITDIKFYTTTILLGLKIPLTLKNLIINKYIDVPNLVKDSQYLMSATYEERRYGSEYINGITGFYFNQSCGKGNGTAILNIWTDNVQDFTPVSTQAIWDFSGVVLENILYTNSHQYIGNNGYYSEDILSNLSRKYTLRNLNLKAKKYALSLYQFNALENVVLDYSEFTGDSITYALGVKGDNNEVIIPLSYDSIKYWDCSMDGIVTNNITWNDPFVLKVFEETLDITRSFRDITLAEQQEEDPRPNFTNEKFTIKQGYDQRPFVNCNLKYIGTLSLPNATRMWRFFAPESGGVLNIEEIGEILVPQCPDLGSLCEGNKVIKKVGRIYSEVEVTTPNMIFRNCSNLEGSTDLDYTINGSMSNSFENCAKVTSIKFRGKVTSFNWGFAYCGASTIDLSEVYTNEKTNCIYTFFSCKNLTELTFNNFIFNGINEMCRDCLSLTKVSFNNCDFSNNANYQDAFRNCPSLTEIDGFPLIETGTLGNVTYNSCFYETPMLTKINGSENINFKFTGTQRDFMSMFYHTGLKYIDFDCSEVGYACIRSLMRGATKAINIKFHMPQNVYYSTPKDTSTNKYQNLFNGCANLEELEFIIGDNVNIDINNTTGAGDTPFGGMGANKKDKLKVINFPVNLLAQYPVWYAPIYMKEVSFYGVATSPVYQDCIVIPYEAMVDLITNHLSSDTPSSIGLCNNKYFYDSDLNKYRVNLTYDEQSNLESLIAEKGWTATFGMAWKD